MTREMAERLDAELKCLTKLSKGKCHIECEDCELLYMQGTTGQKIEDLKELLPIIYTLISDWRKENDQP